MFVLWARRNDERSIDFFNHNLDKTFFFFRYYRSELTDLFR
jgi:hypothetical protein